jgi:NADH dehydrogenase
MFEKYDKDKSGSLDLSEMKTMLKDIDSKMTHLPAVSDFILPISM